MPILDASGNPITPSAANRLPARLGGEVASTMDGRDIFRPFTSGLQQETDPLLASSADWGVYDTIFRDDQVKSCWQQRTTALTSRDWRVTAGGERDIDIAAAALVEENLRRVGWDNVSAKMQMAVYYGYAVSEVIWAKIDGYIQFAGIKVRNARRFRKDAEDRLRLLTPQNMQGERLPDRKFWFLKAGGSLDDLPYGLGLAHWLYWPTVFKRNGLKFWNTFLDKYGAPTAIGRYRPGTPDGDIANLLAALQAIATDTGIVIPDGMAVELLEAARSAGADYDKMVDKMDLAIAKVLLSQTGTTENQAWAGTAAEHAGTRDDVIDADDDLIAEGFMAGPAKWLTEINFPGAEIPRVTRRQEEEGEDLSELADLDAKMNALGYRRSRESVRETYGDEWEEIEGEVVNEAGGLLPAPDDPASPAEFAETADDRADAITALTQPGAPTPFADDILTPLLAAIEDVEDVESARALLGTIAPNLSADQTTETLARAGFAARIAESQGGEK
jgi:phage gp29-like protein